MKISIASTKTFSIVVHIHHRYICPFAMSHPNTSIHSTMSCKRKRNYTVGIIRMMQYLYVNRIMHHSIVTVVFLLLMFYQSTTTIIFIPVLCCSCSYSAMPYWTMYIRHSVHRAAYREQSTVPTYRSYLSVFSCSFTCFSYNTALNTLAKLCNSDGIEDSHTLVCSGCCGWNQKWYLQHSAKTYYPAILISQVSFETAYHPSPSSQDFTLENQCPSVSPQKLQNARILNKHKTAFSVAPTRITHHAILQSFSYPQHPNRQPYNNATTPMMTKPKQSPFGLRSSWRWASAIIRKQQEQQQPKPKPQLWY